MTNFSLVRRLVLLLLLSANCGNCFPSLNLTEFKGELDDFSDSAVRIVNTTTISLQNQQLTNTTSLDVFLKILKVSGISIAGGGLVFFLPLAFYLALTAIGFTGAGTVVFNNPLLLNHQLMSDYYMFCSSTGVALGSCAACCQAGIGAVAAGSWFAALQSIGAQGCLVMYSNLFCWYFLIFLWFVSWPVIGWFIWPLV